MGARKRPKIRGLISPLDCPSKLPVGGVHLEWELVTSWVFIYIKDSSFLAPKTFSTVGWGAVGGVWFVPSWGSDLF